MTDPEMYGDLEHHVMPSGAEVFYRDSDHSYWAGAKQNGDGKWCGVDRLTGVSTVVAPLDFRPDSLMRWAANQNGHGVSLLAASGLDLDDADDMRTALRWLESANSIWAALEEAHLLYSDRTADKAKVGTNVHKHALHALASGWPLPDFAAMTEEEHGYAMGVVGFFMDHEPETLQAEQVVVSAALGVAGRFDLRARMGGETWLVDAKTSGFISAKAHAQIAGYDQLAFDSGFGETDRHGILQVGPDGSYELIEGQATADEFVAALRVYRASARIAKASRKARETA